MPEEKTEEKAPVTASSPDNGKANEPVTRQDPEPEREPEKVDQGHTDEIDLDAIEKDEDGQLTFKAGSSVYKGKDLKELLSNVSQGITEKDRYITKSKLREKVQVPEHIRKSKVADESAPVHEAVELPDRDEILTRHAEAVAKRMGVDLKMAGWTDEQYQAYADEHGLQPWSLTRLVSKVDQALAEADRLATQEFNDRTQVYVNNKILDDERESVVDLLVEAGIDPDEFDFEALLSRVYSDPKSKKPNGVLKSGIVTAEAAKEIRRIASGHQKSEIKKKIEEDIARGEDAKKRIRVGAGLPASQHDKQPKITTYEDAALSAIAYATAKARK